MSKQTITEFLEARIAEDELAAYDLMGEREGDRTLAECAAKRAIIEQADWASSDRSQVISEFCVGQAERDAEYATDPGALILKAIATVYADHAEYDKGWAL